MVVKLKPEEPAEPRDGSRQGVQSVEAGASVLLALAELESPVSLSRLAAAVGMPAGKLHRYLKALIASGLAAQGARHGRYMLGPAALTIGLAALRRVDVLGLAGDRLFTLRDEIGHTCFVAVWGNRGPTVVRVAEAVGSVTIVTRVGSVLPLLHSATGRLFAAYLPIASLAGLAPDEGLDGLADDLASDLAPIRVQGAASVSGLLLPGIDAVAVPILDPLGQIVASLTALGLSPGFDAASDGTVAAALRRAAADIKTQLGGPPLSRGPQLH